MVKLAKLATCNLNQWSMDFDLNLKNVIESIRQNAGNTTDQHSGDAAAAQRDKPAPHSSCL